MSGMARTLPESPPVNPTSVSLLDRLKMARPESPDWLHLHDLYLPLIRSWLRRIPGLGAEADDLAQEVLVVVVHRIHDFDRQREGSFRAWLRQVTVNRVRTYRRQRQRRPAVGLDGADGFLDQLADPHSQLTREWDLEHDRHVFERLLAVIRPDFTATTWEAVRRFALDGLQAAQVAREMGLTENAVNRAKARILKRLREEAGDLL